MTITITKEKSVSGSSSRVLKAKHHLLPKVTFQYQKDERCEVYTRKNAKKQSEKKKDRKIDI